MRRYCRAVYGDEKLPSGPYPQSSAVLSVLRQFIINVDAICRETGIDVRAAMQEEYWRALTAKETRE